MICCTLCNIKGPKLTRISSIKPGVSTELCGKCRNGYYTYINIFFQNLFDITRYPFWDDIVPESKEVAIYFREAFNTFVDMRMVNINNHSDISRNDLFREFCDFVLTVCTKLKLDNRDYMQIWIFLLGNKNLSSKFPNVKLMVECFLVESPSNVFAELLGRISNLIRRKTREKMGESLMNSEVLIYKNTGHISFWEPHLETLVSLQLDVVGGNPSLPTSYIKGQNTKSFEDVYDWTNRQPKRRKLTKNSDKNSNSRRRQDREYLVNRDSKHFFSHVLKI